MQHVSHPTPAEATASVSPALAERWADLTRALSIYPDNNSRVVQAAVAFGESLRGALDPGAASIEVGFSTGVLWIGSRPFDLPNEGSLAWMKERLDRADLSGARFSASVAEEAVVAFSKRLVEAYRRTNLDLRFDDLWSDVPEGITPLERRFDGSFSDASAQSPESRPPAPWEQPRPSPGLQDLLALEPRVRERIEALQARMVARAGHEAEFRRVDIVAEIAQMLPVEALHDRAKAAGMTERVIAALEDKLRGGELLPSMITHGNNAAFRQLLFVISRAHFATGDGDQRPPGRQWQEIEPTCSPAGGPPAAHPADGGPSFDDEVRTLFSELDALGSESHALSAANAVEDAAEQLGVMLHHLALAGDDASPELWEEMVRLLVAAGDDATDVLRPHLEIPPGQGNGGGVRIAAWLRRHGHRDDVERCGVLDASSAVRSFPAGFLAYVATLDLDHAEDRDELDRVCRELGAPAIDQARDLVPEIVDAGLHQLARRLFDLPLPSLTPLVRRFHDRDPARFGDDFRAFLRRTCSPLDKAILDLAAVADRRLIPGYLAALEGSDASALKDRRWSVLKTVFEALEDDLMRADDLVRAIHLLVHFEPRLARPCLDRVISARRLLVLPKHAPEVRRAAAAASARLVRTGRRAARV